MLFGFRARQSGQVGGKDVLNKQPGRSLRQTLCWQAIVSDINPCDFARVIDVTTLLIM